MGTVFTIAGWAAALLFGEIAVSAAARMTLEQLGRHVTVPRCGILLAEVAGAACLAVLALLGVRPWLTAVSAVILLAAAVLPLAKIMRAAAKQDQAGMAGRRIIAALAEGVQIARYLPLLDFRALTGLLRRRDGRDAPAAGGRPDPAVPSRPGPGPVRTVPPVRYDAVIGPAPHPADVAQGLESAGVEVPAPWAAVAEWTRSFEPDTEEDLLEHEAQAMAGILTWAEAEMAKAENLASGNGLDPVYIAGHFELADEAAALASFKALLGARYKALYGSIRDDVDSGLILPEDARRWFGAGGPAQGGQAA